jgi:sulfur carrier protein ThiS
MAPKYIKFNLILTVKALKNCLLYLKELQHVEYVLSKKLNVIVEVAQNTFATFVNKTHWIVTSVNKTTVPKSAKSKAAMDANQKVNVVTATKQSLNHFTGNMKKYIAVKYVT